MQPLMGFSPSAAASLLPTPYSLLPTPYSLLPVPFVIDEQISTYLKKSLFHGDQVDPKPVPGCPFPLGYFSGKRTPTRLG
ncbi:MULTISPECIES: hypothetical protein [unclassified Moorena]|uniref:hypothetical protein n=1 Tax=unclassified Moorena TaxID=2683338 RepID=UPI0025E6F4C9|nr:MULTISPECIES: hypothetical protein [unclassified Moorena]